jgi:hypothetical protein
MRTDSPAAGPMSYGSRPSTLGTWILTAVTVVATSLSMSCGPGPSTVTPTPSPTPFQFQDSVESCTATLLAPAPSQGSEPRRYLCGTLLPDSTRFLMAALDRWTGLPYDNLLCGGPWAAPGSMINRAAGVVPQLAYADVRPFSQANQPSAVEWSFVDIGPDDRDPELLYALRVALHLGASGGGAANDFGGITWSATVDAHRYSAVHIRYATSTADNVWEFKINAGTPGGTAVEPAVSLPGTSRRWKETRLRLPEDFPRLDLTRINYLTLAANRKGSLDQPVLWVDQISFEADPAQMAACSGLCPNPLPQYPDLACYEPLTGAVNVANALTTLSLLPVTGMLDAACAQKKVSQILETLAQLPGSTAGGGWLQDWHSPVSSMPDPRNRVASLTDEPQLYAALMIVESTWPELREKASSIRKRMDLLALYEPGDGCPGQLHGAVDRCTGVRRDWNVDILGTDMFLGLFLASATGAAPACFWNDRLRGGCAIDGPPGAGWYTTGRYCVNPDIPASDTGGPFLQLAALQYLSSPSLGPLTLEQSARNMLLAQSRFAAQSGLALAGWANASDPDGCAYSTCEQFSAAKVTPYVWLMGLDLIEADATREVLALHAAGADAPLLTGTRSHAFGMRDAWNQATGTGRDAYLYLDTGWSTLGLLNYCQSGLVRRTFASHSIAQAGYASFLGRAPVCGGR